MNSYLSYEIAFYRHLALHDFQNLNDKERGNEVRLAKAMIGNHLKGIAVGNLGLLYYRLHFNRQGRGISGIALI